MSHIPQVMTPTLQREPPEELHNGDHMTQPEFHRIYERMPKEFKAELIGGIVYVSPPVGQRHGIMHMPLSTVLFTYEGHTPGVQTADNTTINLGPKGQPQPDAYARILPSHGGQSRSPADAPYTEGPPELVIEIAHATRSIDFHRKRQDYTRYGVQEYLVVNLEDSVLRLFDLKSDKEHPPEPDGVVRIRTFSGLWIDPPALFARDYHRLMAVLQRGLASPEHAAFVQKLAAARAGKATS